MNIDNLGSFATLLEGLIEEISTKIIEEKLKNNAALEESLDEIKKMIKLQHASLGLAPEEGGETKEFFSFWNRGDVIFMSDERLFNREKYPNCPFKSRSALQRIRTKNPDLFFLNNENRLVVPAEDLYDYVTNRRARDIAAGKNIRTYNKRKY